MTLDNSKRVLTMATYVQTELSSSDIKNMDVQPGRALEKVRFIQSLQLTDEELQRLSSRKSKEGRATLSSFAQQSGAPKGGGAVDSISTIDAFSTKELTDLAKELSGHRRDPSLTLIADVFERQMKIAPIGRLHLERLEMSPAGVEKGELLFTVPLSPKETVAISHKEWATSRQEYEDIVQDYLESYSEKGVAEKSDAAMATEAESRHASAFDFRTSMSGGYGPVSMTSSLGLNSSSDQRNSIKQSTQKSREITERASARVRQEHKVSIKIEAASGTEETSSKTITNPYDDRTLRIDYYRLMRKWRTDLFRYGLRMTFDICIPAPGARLWGRYQRLKELDAQLSLGFDFSLKPSGIKDDNWQQLADEAGISLPPPLRLNSSVVVTRQFMNLDISFEALEFTAPANYALTQDGKAHISYTVVQNFNGLPPIALLELDGDDGIQIQTNPIMQAAGIIKANVIAAGNGSYRTLSFSHKDTVGIATFTVGATRQSSVFAEWQAACWVSLRDAALQRHEAGQAKLREEREAIAMSLSGKDALTLRRLEREEIMRQVLSWLIGPSFDPTPAAIQSALDDILSREAAGEEALPTQEGWSGILQFGEVVKFLHQAIEWENIIYFTYPYFWGSQKQASDRMLFEHEDSVHRDFLRSGYARIVIPVRPGFEKDFAAWVDTGQFQGNSNSRYMPIAEEIEAFAKTNYAGIPPANPEKHARPLLYPEQRSTWATMEKVVKLLDDYQSDNNGYYPPTLAELSGGPFLDAWGRELVYTMPGSGNDYDLVSRGADGDVGGEEQNADISASTGASLVASWFEYTPTSGIDIAMDTSFDEMN